MTPQESRALQDFLGQLTQVRGIQKDPEADAAIAKAVAQQPDAAYLLVQRALLQDQALNSAQEQIAQLRNDLQAKGTPRPGGFLDAGNAWGRGAVSPPQPEAQSPVMQAAAPARTPAYGAGVGAGRPPGAGLFGGGGGSFLGNVAATAAGVAGGAFLFHGLQNLLGQEEHAASAPAQPDTSAAAAEPDQHLADNSSTDTDTAAYDDTSADDTDFGGGDGGTEI